MKLLGTRLLHSRQPHLHERPLVHVGDAAVVAEVAGGDEEEVREGGGGGGGVGGLGLQAGGEGAQTLK